MKLIKSILVCSIVFLSISCSKSPAEIENEYIQGQLESFGQIGNERYLVVLPGLGCKGCIQEGEAFMIRYASNPKIRFILTRVESIKLFEQKTGIRIKDHKNILIDRDNHFELQSNNSIYPLIVEMDNGSMKKYEFQSPANPMAFARLGETITAN